MVLPGSCVLLGPRGSGKQVSSYAFATRSPVLTVILLPGSCTASIGASRPGKPICLCLISDARY
eukprot:3774966-Rhodomonas_salina.2